jgi:protein SCO1/2
MQLLRIMSRKLGLLAVGALALSGFVSAQNREETRPKELDEVGVTEHLNEKVDLNLTFIAEDGYPHALKEYFHPGRPVVLNLVYYNCKMLCNVVLNAQVQSLRKIDWTPGEQYEIVTVSIDPAENFQLAREKKASYLESFGRPAPGWHFLADNGGNVRQLAHQVGFGYKFDEGTAQYAHPAVVFVLTPEGKVSRYLYGVQFKPLDVRLALTEAAKGKFGVTDRILLFCFHYDPAAKGYVPFAQNLMKSGGVLTLLIMGFFLYRFWRRERMQAAANRGLVTAK